MVQILRTEKMCSTAAQSGSLWWNSVIWQWKWTWWCV